MGDLRSVTVLFSVNSNSEEEKYDKLMLSSKLNLVELNSLDSFTGDSSSNHCLPLHVILDRCDLIYDNIQNTNSVR